MAPTSICLSDSGTRIEDLLHLSGEHRRAIEAHGAQGYPDEVCGFLIGTARGEERTVTRLVAIENTWDDGGDQEFAEAGASFAGESRRRRFKIPPDEYYRADVQARERGEAILGFYHSHPDHPARPSQYDLALAREIFPGYSYIIVAVHKAQAVDMTSWVLRDDGSQFDEEMVT
jgi:proteasome lid subunit RPN8/RPN11